MHLDPDSAADAISRFNGEPANVVSDWCVARSFGLLGKSSEAHSVLECIVILDGLYQTQLHMKRDVRRAIMESLSSNWQTIRNELEALREVSNVEGSPGLIAELASKLFMYVFPEREGGGRNYEVVFASKFFHWCSPNHFPIVDKNAWRGMRRLQEKNEDQLIQENPPDGQERCEIYGTWINLCAKLLNSLKKEQWKELEAQDQKTQMDKYRIRNSRLRILDKILYCMGRGN